MEYEIVLIFFTVVFRDLMQCFDMKKIKKKFKNTHDNSDKGVLLHELKSTTALIVFNGLSGSFHVKMCHLVS